MSVEKELIKQTGGKHIMAKGANASRITVMPTDYVTYGGNVIIDGSKVVSFIPRMGGVNQTAVTTESWEGVAYPVGAWISFEYPVTSVTLGADSDMIDFQLTKI